MPAQASSAKGEGESCLRAVIQRVNRAAVSVDGQTVGEIGQGFLVFLGVAQTDQPQDADYIIAKLVGLRIFEDQQGKMNLALGDVGGAVLLVSQFTLLADARQGRRPGFTQAADPAKGEAYYQLVHAGLQAKGIPVATGVFRAEMLVTLENQGPVTIILDSTKIL